MTTLTLHTYRPDFSNKKVRTKVKKVLEWATQFVVGKNDSYLQMHSTSTIRTIFGNTSNNDLARWLKAQLLIDSGSGYVAGIRASSYKINRDKFEQIEYVLLQYGDIDPLFRINRLRVEFEQELACKKPFEYTDKSFRLWHRIQYAPSIMRDQLFEGWANYDIEVALPTIFFQLHERYSGQQLPNLQSFINDKRAIRQMIADELDIEYDLAKEILTALFQGAKLNAFEKCAVFREIRKHFSKLDLVISNKDIQSKLYKLKDIDFIVNLQDEIKTFWKTTFVAINEQRIQAGLPKIDKSLLYFFYERQVLDEVRNWLNEKEIPHFLEHDGFRTNAPIDIDEIKKLVKEKTGLQLNWTK